MQKDIIPVTVPYAAFLGCHSKFGWHTYMFASHLHSCKILQLYVAATVWMHSDAIFSSIIASQTLTKVLHFAIGKPMAYHDKFAAKRTAKSTLANYSKLSRTKHCGKKRSPASHKRMANNGIFTFHGVKASHGLLRYFSWQINKKNGKSAAFCQKMLVFWTPEKPQQTVA